MRFPHSEIWSLSSFELAEKCQEIAGSNAGPKDSMVREEARRLYMNWTRALDTDTSSRTMAAQQAAHLAALRRRTIQLLLKLEA